MQKGGDKMVLRFRESCPELGTIRAGDESVYVCTLNGKYCPVFELGNMECEHYDEFLEELENEDRSQV